MGAGPAIPSFITDRPFCFVTPQCAALANGDF
jgi:hypothetical protein